MARRNYLSPAIIIETGQTTGAATSRDMDEAMDEGTDAKFKRLQYLLSQSKVE